MNTYVPEIEDDLWLGKYLLLHEPKSKKNFQNQYGLPSKKIKKIVSTRIVTYVDPLKFKLEDLAQEITEHVVHKTDVVFILSWRKIIKKDQDPIRAIVNDEHALSAIQGSIGKGFCIHYLVRKKKINFCMNLLIRLMELFRISL